MRRARAVLVAAPLLGAGMAPAEPGDAAPNDVVGADAGGKSTEKELSGDAAAVEGRRNAAMARRRRTAAIQAQLNQIKPFATAPVSAQALVDDRQAAEKSRGVAEKTAGSL